MAMHAPKRKYLVDALNEALPQLQKAFIKERKGRTIGDLLQREVMDHADATTLERIVVDLKNELHRLAGAGLIAGAVAQVELELEAGVMKVRDAMANTISCATRQDNIAHVAHLMKRDDTGFIPVVDGDNLVGVVTDRDIVIRCLAAGHINPLSELVEHVMSTDVETISPDDDLQDAADKMADKEIRRLAVVVNGKLVGVLSHGNLAQATNPPGAGLRATREVTEGA